MAYKVLRLCACILLLMAIVANGAPKAKNVKCKDKKYADCYKKKLLCPDSCLRTCVVDCVTCQPVCQAPPPSPPSPPPPPPKPAKAKKVRCKEKKYPACYKKQLLCPNSCPRTCVVDCASCQPVCRALPPPPLLPLPPQSSTSPPPAPTVTPVSPPSTATSPPSPPHVTPVSPPSTSTSPPAPPPVSPPSTEISPARAYCKNRTYPQCYRRKQNCPNACPSQCEVDCVKCSPVCNCDKPGAVCQDPRFIGGDGITFYFHGKKDHEFCILSDSNLHINAHFIGRRNENMKRDFTWVQSLGILFDNHQLYVGAMKTANWDNAVDRLELTFNGQQISLPEGEGARWSPKTAPNVSITRLRDTNTVGIEVEGNFKIKANVVPITRSDSRVHNYGITEEDCFAHLDLGFSFYSLSGDVNGVLGQTYASNYTSRVKMGVDMPVLGGDKEFASSSLFSTDCAVAQFSGRSDSLMNIESNDLNCASRIDGHGVICKR